MIEETVLGGWSAAGPCSGVARLRFGGGAESALCNHGEWTMDKAERRRRVSVPWLIRVWNMFWLASLWQWFRCLPGWVHVALAVSLLGVMGGGAYGVHRWYRARRDPRTYLDRAREAIAAEDGETAARQFHYAIWYAKTPAAKASAARELAAAFGGHGRETLRDAYGDALRVVRMWYEVLEAAPDTADEAVGEIMGFHHGLAVGFDVAPFWRTLAVVGDAVVAVAPQSLRAHRYRTFGKVRMALAGQAFDAQQWKRLETDLAALADRYPEDPRTPWYRTLYRVADRVRELRSARAAAPQPGGAMAALADVPDGGDGGGAGDAAAGADTEAAKDDAAASGDAPEDGGSGAAAAAPELTAEDLEQAAEPLRAFLKQHPESLDGRLQLLEFLTGSGGGEPGKVSAEVERLLKEAEAMVGEGAGVEPFRRLAQVHVALGLRRGAGPRFGALASRLATAAGIVDQGVAQHGEVPELLLTRAEIYRLRGETDQAAALFRKVDEAIEIRPQLNAPRRWAWKQAAWDGLRRIYVRQALRGKSAERAAAGREAERYMARLATGLTPVRVTEIGAGQLLIARGQPRAGAAALLKLGREVGQVLETVLPAGLALAEVGELGAARAMLEQVAEHPGIAPEDYRDVVLTLARMELATGDQERVSERLDALLAVWPEDAAVWEVWAALVLQRLLKGADAATVAEAEATLTKHVGQGGGTVAVALAQLLTRVGRRDAAAKVLADAAAAYPASPEPVRAQLSFLFHSAPPGVKAEVAERLLGPWRERPLAGRLVRLLAGGGDWAQVAPVLNAVLADDAVAGMGRLAAGYVEAGRLGEARDVLAVASKAAKDDDPRLFEARFQVALSSAEEGAARAALERYGTALAAPQRRVCEGMIALREGRNEAAAAAFSEAAEAWAFYGTAWSGLGRARRALGDDREARVAWVKALQIQPGNAVAMMGLYDLVETGSAEQQELMRAAFAAAPRSMAIQHLCRRFLAGIADPATQLQWRAAFAVRMPGDEANRRVIGGLLARLGKGDAAREVLGRLLAQRPSRENAMAMSELLLAQGDVAGAVRIFEARAAEQGPGRVVAWADLARLYGMVGQRAKVGPLYEQALTVPVSDHVSGLQHFAAVLAELGAFAEAETLLKRVYETTRDADCGARYCQLLLALGRDGAAAQLAAEILNSRPDHGGVMELALLAARRRGDTEGLRRLLGQAVAQFPESPVPYLKRARYLLGMEELAAEDLLTAQQDLDKALALRPDSEAAVDLTVALHRRNGAIGQAMALLEAMAERHPEAPRWVAKQVALLLEREDYGALEALMAEPGVKGRFGQAAVWHHWQAALLEARGDRAGAIAARVRALELEATAQNLHAALAACLEAGAFRQGLGLVRDHPELTAAAPALDAFRGHIAATAGDPEAAGEIYDGILKASPAGLDAVCAGILQVLDAKQAAAVLVRLSRRHPGCRRWAIQAQVAAGDAAAAVAAARNLADDAELSGAERDDAAQLLGLALSRAGETAEAIAVYRQLHRRFPNDLATVNNLAFMLAEAGQDVEQAVTLARKGVHLAPAKGEVAAQALDTLGYALLRAGELHPAEDALRKSLRLADRADARLHLAQVLALRADAAGAIAELKRAYALAKKGPDALLLDRIREMARGLQMDPRDLDR